MQRILFASILFIAMFWSLSFTNAMPIKGIKKIKWPRLSSSPPGPPPVLIGWKGIQNKERMERFLAHPSSSGGGELGDVVYVTDSTDLARFFGKHGYVCQVYATAEPWGLMPKSWVTQQQIAAHHGNAAALYPGAVLFASHMAGLGHRDDQSPWQLGIRPEHISRLGLTAKCYPMSDPTVPPHLKLHYDTMAAWNIHGTPEKGR